MKWSNPIGLGGSVVGPRAHICAFFSDSSEEHSVLLPFIQEGLERGEKLVHTLNPERRREHLQWLASEGIDVDAAQKNHRLELRDWTDTHLCGGAFDQDKTLAIFDGIVKNAKQEGFPLIRFITHMEWALGEMPGVGSLLEYEAKANAIWLQQEGPVNPVICTYDLTRFGADVIVDVMRTHPMIIIGGILQENPFFVQPDEFLRKLAERQARA